MLDPRGQFLRAAVSISPGARCSRTIVGPCAPVLAPTPGPAIGHVAVGMHRQNFRPSADAVRRARPARDALHDGHGALAHVRSGIVARYSKMRLPTPI